MERYEEIWEGISEEVFSGKAEEMQAEYIDLPNDFLKEKLKEWCKAVGYKHYDSIRLNNIVGFKPEYIVLLFEKINEGDKKAIKIVNAFLNNSIKELRVISAKNGYGLEKLISDESDWVRQTVAEQGYGLEKLINDDSNRVLCAVARQGYGLKKLIDGDIDVRREVAEQGFALDILVYDNNCNVRNAVASQGYGLDVLVYDREYYVRREVAKLGYRLDLLFNDESEEVIRVVAETIGDILVKGEPELIAELAEIEE